MDFDTLQDVSELRQAQVQTNCREQLFTSLMENSCDGIAVIDARGHLCYTSPAIAHILNFAPHAIQGKSVFDLVHGDDVARLKARSRRLPRKAGRKFTDEFRFCNDTGAWLWIKVTASNQLHNKVVGAVVCNFRDVTQRKAREAELLATNKHLLELSQHLRTSVEMERTRIARELHDELGSTLMAIKLYLGKSKADASLSHWHALALLDSANDSIARIVTNLRPSVLDHQGLLPAIQWLAAEFTRRTGLACYFNTTVADVDDGLGEREKAAVFRICQETLLNVSRHAHAKAVTIHIKQVGSMIKLKISDDGVGFMPESAPGHPTWGIIGMRERAAELGGKFEMISAPNAGTTVLLSLRVQHFVSKLVTDRI